MEEKKKQNPKLKLALAIAIPVMVMIVTISMVGASFAWFTDQATAEIATINLTTRDVFTLTFTIDPVSGEDIPKYQGETAFAYTKTSTSGSAKALYLINDYRAKAIYNYGDSKETYQTYMQDAPFTFKSTINLDTDDRYVDMNIAFDTVNISKTSIDASNNTITNVLSSYGEGLTIANSYLASDIPYCFTWYMKKTGSIENKYYTPYGIIEYDVDETDGFEYATKLNGTSVTASTSIASMPTNGMVNFYTNGVEKFDIYVVFCPEKLYWMQYFQADRDKSLEQVYTTATERNKIVSSDYPNQIYYSASSFWGSIFAFAANMTVSRVDWEKTVSGGDA